MRLTASSIYTLSSLLGLIGCSGSTSLVSTETGGAGTVQEVGGSTSTNGSGGASLGSAPTNGGSPATGGKLGTGGVIVGVGGALPTGGKAGVGGAITASGGSPASTGGQIANATGGSLPNGTGGAPSTAGCTDTPRSTESCSDAKSWGFCGQAWFAGYCNATCGTCSSISTGGSVSTGGRTGSGGGIGAGGNAPTGGARTGGTAATGGARTGGTPATGGLAATGGNASSGSCSWTSSSTTVSGSTGYGTRYWDCCMPSCSWTTSLPYCDANGTTQHTGTSNNPVSGCNGGGAFECFNFTPWYDAATNTSYGFAAYNGAPCGSCYALQFTGEGQYGPTAGSTSLKGKQMIVQVINIGGLGGNQFDLLIPGGGVGDFAAGCQTQLSGADLGNTSGGMLAKCAQDVACTRRMCNAAFASRPDMLAGCLWFTDCFQGADNPKFVYSKVTCPSQLTAKSKISG